ncbi:MAG: TonB-dependent receptor [Bacteroidota bacterium]
MKNYYILILLLISSNWLNAQISLSGTVIDQNNEIVVGANVVIKELNLGKATNSKGEFSFKNLRAGNYSVTVTFVGMTTHREKVKVDSNRKLEIILETSAFLTDEITVTATRASSKTPVAYTNITKEEINTRNLGQDIPILMELTPSYVSTSDGGNGVGYTNMRIRGSDNTRINVTMNGIPMNDAESHGVWWVNMPDLASSLEDIQIQRGVGTSTNGAGAFGASINLRTNAINKDPYAELNGTYGSFNTQKYNLKAGSGLLVGKFTIDARASKIHTDGFIDRAKVDLQSVFLSGSYYGDNNSVIFNYIDGKENTYQAWNGVPKNYLSNNNLRTYNNYTYKNEIDNYHQTHYQLFYNQKISENWNSDIAGFYVRGSGYYEQFKNGYYEDGEDLDEYGIIVTDEAGNKIEKSALVRQKWLDNHFYGGVFNFTYNKESTNIVIGGGLNKYEGDHFGKVLWVKEAPVQDIDPLHEYYRNSATKTDCNFYSKVNQQIDDHFNIYLDLQYRRINYKFQGLTDEGNPIPESDSHNFILPKAGINYSINDNSSVFFSFAKGAKEPNRGDYTENPIDQVPLAEYMNDLEAGYKFSGSNLILEANAYYMQYTNQLISTGKLNDVGNYIRTNVPDSYRAGIELAAAWKISSMLRWNANISYSQSIIKEYTEYIDDWDNWTQIPETFTNTKMAFAPDVVAASNFTITPLKGLSFNIISKYVGEQFIDNTENNLRKLDAYFVNNFKAEYKFNIALFEEVAITAIVNNIFDQKYETNAWAYKYKSGDGSYDGSFGDKYSTKSDKPGYYDMAGYFPQAGINFLLGLRLKI